MKDSLNDAAKELKRVDHLIHVSLKYTRTVDVLISVLKRFISSMDFIIQALLLKAKELERIPEPAESPIGKANQVKELYDDPEILKNIESYALFRRLVRSEYTKRNEYRRYVTMTVDDNGTIVEIDIDRVVEYFDEIKKFLQNATKIVNET